jgi:hypothetical protein
MKKISPPLPTYSYRRFLPKMGLSILAMFFLYLNVIAQPEANIIIQPSATITSLNANFTVNVRVDFITPPASSSVDGVEIRLNFDNTKLQVVSITKPVSSIFVTEIVPLADLATINANGQINYAAVASSNFPNSDFDFLAITFNAIAGTGTSTSLVYTPVLTDAQRLGSSILENIANGSVTINSCTTPPTASISASSGATTCNSQPVRLFLNSATNVGPYSLVINGTTYNGVSAGTGVEFATVPFPTYKIWPSNPTPIAPQNNDSAPIEVGTKIRSSQTGFIKGIRFYNGYPTPGGIYRAKLWNGTTLAGSVDFPAISGVGWKEVLFASPILIAANTTYIASVYSSQGNYAVSDGYFTSSVVNGPLTAPRDNDFGPNGLYHVGEGMPNTPYMQSNYWVDVIFQSNTNTFNLTSVTDAGGCANVGSLQTVNVLSVDCATLPVTLVNLSASPGSTKVTVRWTTSSEINNRGFDVERSIDGNNWIKVGFVNGAGTSNAPISYSYLDQNLEPRKYYYRLKQIDIDDRYRYSAIVSASLVGKADFSLGQNYPNPVNNQTTIQYMLPRAEKVIISLFDMSGRVVKTLVNGSKEAGNHAINVYTGTLSKGVYYYKMQAGDFTDVKKLTIQ